MSSAIGEAKGVNLNKASPEQLDRIGGLGNERVQQLIENRPYSNWDDLRKVEGFGGTLVDDLKNAGAEI